MDSYQLWAICFIIAVMIAAVIVLVVQHYSHKGEPAPTPMPSADRDAALSEKLEELIREAEELPESYREMIGKIMTNPEAYTTRRDFAIELEIAYTRMLIDQSAGEVHEALQAIQQAEKTIALSSTVEERQRHYAAAEPIIDRSRAILDWQNMLNKHLDALYDEQDTRKDVQ